MKIMNIFPRLISSTYGYGSPVFGQQSTYKSIVYVYLQLEDDSQFIAEIYQGIYMPELVGETVRQVSKYIVGLHLETFLRNSIYIPFCSDAGVVSSVIGSIHFCALQAKAKISQKSLVTIISEYLYDECWLPNTSLKFYFSGGSVAMSPQEITSEISNLDFDRISAYKIRCGYQSVEIDNLRIAATISALSTTNNIAPRLIVDLIQGTINPNGHDNRLNVRLETILSQSPLWIEEAVSPSHLYRFNDLYEISDFPFSIGESFTSFNEYFALLSNFKMAFAQIDITSMGGVPILKRLINFFKNQSLTAHVWGSAIAYLSNLAVAYACKNVEWMEVPVVPFEINKHLVQDFSWNAAANIQPLDIDMLLLECAHKDISMFSFRQDSAFRL